VPGHDSLESKLAGARLLREEAGIGRDILVDDLAGTVHRAYGLMPKHDVGDRPGRPGGLQGELDQRGEYGSLPR